ncbi:MAG: hypothetical protein PHT77_09600 [Bacteroidales bacterium]|nr:hypothetical protein [Bacteroidales bacterium]MDD3962102.1 hypothetical protein [Bacteroidales bacterium]HPE87473.1 hypothetical protein [Bacteroidales bacterium]
MDPIRIALVHHKQPENTLLQHGEQLAHLLFGAHSYCITAHNPEVLLFISGGSEQQAVSYCKKNNFPLLLAGSENNAFAAATEVLSYCHEKKIWAKRFSTNHPDAINEILEYIWVIRQLTALRNQTLGLIGDVSDWLVNSIVAPRRLEQVTGMKIKHFPWHTLPDPEKETCPENFLAAVTHAPFQSIYGSGSLYGLLKSLILTHQLAGVSVECFSLVTKKQITACLPLALLNAEGIPAACEGDMISLAGMMLIKAVTGHLPWMANIVMVQDNEIRFAHCTIPLNMPESQIITTHYETGMGTAVKGRLQQGNYTLVRFNSPLTRVFIAEAVTKAAPEIPEACRTQLVLELNKSEAQLLMDKPLGNHHLIFPGHYAHRLQKMAEVLNLATNFSS